MAEQHVAVPSCLVGIVQVGVKTEFGKTPALWHRHVRHERLYVLLFRLLRLVRCLVTSMEWRLVVGPKLH